MYGGRGMSDGSGSRGRQGVGFALCRRGRCEKDGIGGRDGSGLRVTSTAHIASGRRVGNADGDGFCVGSIGR